MKKEYTKERRKEEERKRVFGFVLCVLGRSRYSVFLALPVKPQQIGLLRKAHYSNKAVAFLMPQGKG